VHPLHEIHVRHGGSVGDGIQGPRFKHSWEAVHTATRQGAAKTAPGPVRRQSDRQLGCLEVPTYEEHWYRKCSRSAI
jgi:hypothetical protein